MNEYTSEEAILPFLFFANVKTGFIWNLLGQRKKVLLNDLDHMTKRAATPIYGNIYFYRNTGLIWSIVMKLDMYQWRLWPIVVSSNNDPVLSLTCFMPKSVTLIFFAHMIHW